MEGGKEKKRRSGDKREGTGKGREVMEKRRGTGDKGRGWKQGEKAAPYVACHSSCLFY